MEEFGGKVALVTGSSRGIGLATAEALAAAGATVVLNGRDAARLAGPVERLLEGGRKAEAAAFDTSDEPAVEAAINGVIERYGRLDILVNNAGIADRHDVFETQLSDWNRMLQINLTGPFLCSRAAMRTMRRQKAGRIIMISSTSGQRGAPSGNVAYGASKAGLFGLVHSLAYTAASFGVTVNAVAPGLIDTDMLHDGFGTTLPDAVSRVPLGLGVPTDIAGAVVFLAGQSGRYITGATIDVNGGLYIR